MFVKSTRHSQENKIKWSLNICARVIALQTTTNFAFLSIFIGWSLNKIDKRFGWKMNEVLAPFVCVYYLFISTSILWSYGGGGLKEDQQWRCSWKGKEGMTIVNQLGGTTTITTATRGGRGIGISRVVGMCTGSNYHNILSLLLVTITTTNNTIVTINEILLGLFVLFC